MKRRVVRLTESDLRRIVKRVIKEDMGGMDDVHPRFGNLNLSDYSRDELMGMNDEGELSRGEVIELIADFLEQNVLPELDPTEVSILQSKVDSSNASNLAERYLRENEDLPRNMGGRNAEYMEKAMMGGGAGLALTGAVSALGSFMGWSEFLLTQKIHQYVDSLGLGNYAGPISVAMVAAGLALVLGGRNMKYRRTGI